MDRLELDPSDRPLQIRSGHTPVNIGFMIGSMTAAVPALVTEATRSRAVDHVLPQWAVYAFYAVLLAGSALTLYATYRQLPTELTPATYRAIVNRLVCERVGHYAVAGILLCFAAGALSAAGWSGLSAGAWLVGIAGGLLLRARQTHADVNKLHRAVEKRAGSSVVLADPDDDP
jgi:hypothetical protein